MLTKHKCIANSLERYEPISQAPGPDCVVAEYNSFSYCPLISLFCSKGANNEINRTHKWALRALHGDYESTFEELLDKDKSMKIHKKNLQRLMVAIYKIINHLNPAYMWEFFLKKDVSYNLCSNELCKILSVNSQRYGISSLSFR